MHLSTKEGYNLAIYKYGIPIYFCAYPSQGVLLYSNNANRDFGSNTEFQRKKTHTVFLPQRNIVSELLNCGFSIRIEQDTRSTVASGRQSSCGEGRLLAVAGLRANFQCNHDAQGFEV